MRARRPPVKHCSVFLWMTMTRTRRARVSVLARVVSWKERAAWRFGGRLRAASLRDAVGCGTIDDDKIKYSEEF